MSTSQDAVRGEYHMTISRLTVDKLGVKLYDRVSAVLAELVANSYDADATEVTIRAPMGLSLASKRGGTLTDSGFMIEVSDNGNGMTPEEVQAFYLTVGAERRTDPRRGATSKKFGRKVMGRKGVGKLAPFGICHRIEVITSGGEPVTGFDADGCKAEGYKTAHLVLDSREILQPTDEDYRPEVGALDGTVSARSGTRLILSDFNKRIVPSIDSLDRQLAQRFGIRSDNWTIILVDSQKTEADPEHRRSVGQFEISTMEGTRLAFHADPSDTTRRSVKKEDGTAIDSLDAGFEFEGNFYPITGWVGYSREPYKDELMAGIRIYCNKKIAAQTSIFNRKAGFTGEHDVRSYLVGELHADWLDVEEDLIQTDRRDILWSSDLGNAFQDWGQSVVRFVGKSTRDPLRKKSWDIFREKTDIEAKVRTAFPLDDQEPIRHRAMDFARLLGERIKPEEMGDESRLEDVIQLTLSFAPHVTLDESLRQAADPNESALTVVTTILQKARVAELSSFGLIAEKRVKVIDRVEQLKDDGESDEGVLQKLLQEAPWLIDPQWSPIIANQTFNTLQRELEKFLSKELGEEVHLSSFEHPRKRPDFVLTSFEGTLELIEIKKPGHSFDRHDMDRFQRYFEAMEKFFGDSANAHLTGAFPNWHVTLIADNVDLSGVHAGAYRGLKVEGKLERLTWRAFLAKTKKMHEEFVNEAERQRRLPTATSVTEDE